MALEYRNPVCLLNEYIQKNKLQRIVFIHKFDEQNKIFCSMCIFNKKTFNGNGTSKKLAESAIATEILKYIDNEFELCYYVPSNDSQNDSDTTKISPKIQSNSKEVNYISLVNEYIQKNKIPYIKYIHKFNQRNNLFESYAIFNHVKFTGSGHSKKLCELKIAHNIMKYINKHEHDKLYRKYTCPETYNKLILIDLENFTSMPLDILTNYSKYRIIGYLTSNHSLVPKLKHIKQYMEMVLVDCSYRDAVDIKITIDVARYENKIEKIYLLTGDHFGPTLAKLVNYCECITDYKYLMNYNNILLCNE